MILLNGKHYKIDTPFTDSNGTQYPANWYRLATQQQKITIGFTEVPDPPPIDERYYYLNTDGTVIEKPLQHCKDQYKMQLSNVRWSHETKGIIYANNIFDTDQQARVNYLGAFIQATSNTDFTIVWKAKNIEKESVFVTLTSNDVINIVTYGTEYISRCFAHEKNLIQQIDSINNLNDLLNINLDSDWPDNNY